VFLVGSFGENKPTKDTVLYDVDTGEFSKGPKTKYSKSSTISL